MGKITCWTKRSESARAIIWDNDLNDSTCVVTASNKLWSVNAQSGEGYTLKKHAAFKSRSAAKKFAISWMRKHPKG